MPRIILASQSPRRRQLLGQIGLTDFDILVPDADESYDPSLTPQEIVCSISRKKAEAARALCGDSDTVILAADTMVFLDGLRLGKPHSEAEAFQMLSALSGREHLVCTGVTMCRGDRPGDPAGDHRRPLCLPLRGGHSPVHCHRGADGQSGGPTVSRVWLPCLSPALPGNYFNVMGLPLHLVGEMLRSFGVELLSGRAEP